MVWLPRWGCDGMMIGSNQKLLMARAGVNLADPAWNVDNASYSGNSFSVVAENDGPVGVFFKPDGTEMYIMGSGSVSSTYRRSVIQYSLTSAWDVSTASFTQAFSAPEYNALFFKSDGLKLYLFPDFGNVYQYSLSTAWDISTLSLDQSVSGGPTPTGVFFKPDGAAYFVINGSTDAVDEYSLSTAWDISSASFVQSKSVPTSEATPQDVFFKPDGTKMYIIGRSADRVYQYSLSTPWDISTAGSPETNFIVVSQDSSPTGLFFKEDGTQFWVVGDTNDTVFAYNIG